MNIQIRGSAFLQAIGSTLLAIALTAASTPSSEGAEKSEQLWKEGDIGPIAQITLEAEVAPRPVLRATAKLSFRSGDSWSGAATNQGIESGSAGFQMRVGSQTKTYTGTVILQMVQEGKISLDDTLLKWLPDSGVPHADKITIYNLLNMTSGIPEYLTAPASGLSGTCPTNPPTPVQTVLDKWVEKRGLMKASPADLIHAANCGSNPGPGKMAYSNTNFVLLGMIAEKIACGGSPPPTCYIDELQRRVFKRLPPMKATIFPSDAEFHPGPYSDGQARAVAKTSITGLSSLVNPDANSSVDFTHVQPEVPWTAGAMISSAIDEAIWVSQLAENRFNLLSTEMQDKRLTEFVDGKVGNIPAKYGLAIYKQRSLLNNVEMLGHAGSIIGYTSSVFRRLDTETDYAANVATYLLTDQFSAPVIVWILDRNVWGALNSRGNCGSRSGYASPVPSQGVCHGDNVRMTPLKVAGALELQPSGKFYETYLPAPPGMNRLSVITRESLVPTIAFYGHDNSAVELRGSGKLTVQPDAALAMVGNRSVAIKSEGQGNNISINGEVTAFGRDISGLIDFGRATKILVGGRLTGSTVWWNPDLTFFGVPSVDMVSVPGDTSATVDLAGVGGELVVSGLVRTQRIKTAALRLRPAATGYAISTRSTGVVIGPIVIEGSENTLSIAPGGLGLFVAESLELARGVTQKMLTADNAKQTHTMAFRDTPVLPAAEAFIFYGVPGMPPVRRPPLNAGLESEFVLNSAPRAPVSPPAALCLSGRANQVTIGGSLVGSIPSKIYTDYTKNVVAVDERGSDNVLSIPPGGWVIGDIILGGKATRMRLDGSVKGNVIVADSSIVIEGEGRIEGTLTVSGAVVSQYGNLKFGPPGNRP